MSKLLVIFGATGTQGGSVITSVLSDSTLSSQYKLRAITRDATKPAAKALQDKGVEVITADLDDAESVNKAVQGAYGVFALTDFWAKLDPELEIKQGKNMVDASKAATIQHLVISVLESPKKISNGELTTVEHFETKSEIAAYAAKSGVPTTYFLPGFYSSNLSGGMLRKDDASGKYVLALPIKADSTFPIFAAAEDTGKYVSAIFRQGSKLFGKKIYGAVGYYTPLQILEGFTKAFPKDGKDASFYPLDDETYKQIMMGVGMPERAVVNLVGNMHLLRKEWGYYGGASLDESNAILDQPATTWEQYIKTVPAWKDLE